MIEECCKFVEQMPDKETKVKLIDVLRTVTEGKVTGLQEGGRDNNYHIW